MRPIDLTGRRFGMLLVLRRLDPIKKQTVWQCICDCGAMTNMFAANLTRGFTESCGCARRTHGLTNHYLAAIHGNIMGRCYNPKFERFCDYGGRGIYVHPDLHQLQGFVTLIVRHLGERPDGMTLERKNNELGYELTNLKWATRTEQARNKRNNRILTHDGISMPLVAWAERIGISASTLRSRLDLYGWSVERALSSPIDTIRKGASK